MVQLIARWAYRIEASEIRASPVNNVETLSPHRVTGANTDLSWRELSVIGVYSHIVVERSVVCQLSSINIIMIYIDTPKLFNRNHNR